MHDSSENPLLGGQKESAFRGGLSGSDSTHPCTPPKRGMCNFILAGAATPHERLSSILALQHSYPNGLHAIQAIFHLDNFPSHLETSLSGIRMKVHLKWGIFSNGPEQGK